MGTKIFIPKMGANIDTVEIGKLYVKVGDSIKKKKVLFEIITDKATFDIEADEDGKILALNCKEGDTLNVLDEVGFIGDEEESIPLLKRKESKETLITAKIKATPAAKKLAKEHSLDLNMVFAGTQKIIKEKDVLDYMINLKNSDIIPEKINFIKKKEIEHLSKSKEYITSSITINISVLKLKENLRKKNDKYNIMLSVGEYISYETSRLLKNFPKLNAFYTSNQINIYKNINIGIATVPHDDLFVPVIHNADNLDIVEFHTTFIKLIRKTIKNQLDLKDINEGTFTITDLSSFRAITFNPVINSDQSAILGIACEYDSYVNLDGKSVYDPKMNLILAFDHRVVNGKYVAKFLNELKEKLEDHQV